MTKIATRLTFIILTLCACATASRAQGGTQADDARLRKAVFREIGYDGAPKDFKYVSKSADLNGDGREEVLVWVPSPDFGGTGGYPLLLFARKGRGYRLLWKNEAVWTPLVVLKTKSNGWRDVAVLKWVSGEGMHYVVFRHKGRAYPKEPAGISERRVRGRVLMEQGWVWTPLGPIPRWVLSR